MSFLPDSSKRIFHHIANNPVWRKYLGLCRNIFSNYLNPFFYFCIYLLLWFRIIKLIQPSNNLNSIFPIVLWYQLNHLLNDTTFTEQIIRQKKLCIISNLLEHSRQNLIQGVTLHD